MKNFFKIKQGFTLVEILITVGILGILGVYGVGRYRDFNKSEKLRQAVRNIKTGLQEAQKRAQAGEVDETLCDGLTFEGWTLVFESATSFRIEGRCSGVAFSPKSFSALPPGISFVYPSPGEEITFRPGGLGASANLTIILEGSGSKQESLGVYTSGEIALLPSTPPVPTPSPSPSPSPAAVICESGGVPQTTGWGEDLYGCEGTNKRCDGGSCVTCGGYLYSDGCGGCAGQGGQGCWYLGGSGSNCTGTCSSRGGCATGNWDDTSSCSVMRSLGGSCTSCLRIGFSGCPIWWYWYGTCFYRGGGSVSCNVSMSGFQRACVCEY